MCTPSSTIRHADPALPWKEAPLQNSVKLWFIKSVSMPSAYDERPDTEAQWLDADALICGEICIRYGQTQRQQSFSRMALATLCMWSTATSRAWASLNSIMALHRSVRVVHLLCNHPIAHLLCNHPVAHNGVATPSDPQLRPYRVSSWTCQRRGKLRHLQCNASCPMACSSPSVLASSR